MLSTTVDEELREQLDHLPMDQKHQVLEFARSLVEKKDHGVAGKDLLQFAGKIGAEDLVAIERAIKEGCEKLNPDEW